MTPSMPSRSKRALPRRARSLGAGLFWLGFWALVAELVGQPLLLPTPVQVGQSLLELMGELPFYLAVGASLWRMLLAFGLGVLLGAGLAVLARIMPWAGALLSPALGVIRATPVSSFIILALVWLSSSQVPVFTGLIMVLPIVYGNVEQGIHGVDPQLLEVAWVFRFGRSRTFSQIYLPSVLPTLLAACHTALGLCWKASIAAEVLGVPRQAVGTQLYQAKIYLQTDRLMAYTLVVVALSIGMERAMAYLTGRRCSRGHQG